MYNYMRALEDRFAPRPDRKQRRKLEAKRQEASALLDKEGKRNCSGWWTPTRWHRKKWH